MFCIIDVISSEVENRAAGEAATSTERPAAERMGVSESNAEASGCAHSRIASAPLRMTAASFIRAWAFEA